MGDEEDNNFLDCSFDFEDINKNFTSTIEFKRSSIKNTGKRRSIPNLIRKKGEIVLDEDHNVLGCVIPTEESKDEIIIEEKDNFSENDTESDEIPDEKETSKNIVQEKRL